MPARGVWFDLSVTSSTDPKGVTVGVLHTGSSYPDDLTDEQILYHYPTTKNAGRDRHEVEATKAAADLQLPVFVIRYPTADLRDVRRGRIVGHDDDLEIFNIELETPFGAIKPIPRRRRAAAGSFPEGFAKYLPADESTTSSPRDPFTWDPDKIDKGLRGHATTQNALATWLGARSYIPSPRRARPTLTSPGASGRHGSSGR